MSGTDIQDRVFVLERLVEALIVQNMNHEAELIAFRNVITHEQLQKFYHEREVRLKMFKQPIYRKIRGLV